MENKVCLIEGLSCKVWLLAAEDCLFKRRKEQLQIWEEIFWRRKAFITPCSEEGAYGRVSVATREGYIIGKERGEFRAVAY